MADEKSADGQENAPQKKRDQKEQRSRKASTIVRLAGRDVDGSLSIDRAIRNVKGIGFAMANAMSNILEKEQHIDRSTEIGSLSEQQVSALESIMYHPENHGMLKFMLNHRKEFETGKDIHQIGNDLTFGVRQDITREINLRTWRGYRHQYGQKVRGQHSRSTGRTGATVGVMKKATKEQAQQAATTAAAKKTEAAAPASAKK